MSVQVSIVGKEISFYTYFKKLLERHAIETVVAEKTHTLSSSEFVVFLESAQAQKWAQRPLRLPPSLLLPEIFPPPIPLKKLADANIRLMPRETEGSLLVTLLLLDLELHRFPKSISDLSEESQQAMLSIFEEFRHALCDAALQLHGLLMQQTAHPNSKNTLSEMRALVHRLAGSAGSYGFMALSNAAKTLEEAMKNQQQPEIENLSHEFLDMLSLLLPLAAHAPPLLKTLLVYNPGQKNRSQHAHGFRNLGIHTLWAMDWVECWKMAQTRPLGGAVLNMDKLPVESWPQLFEALSSSPAFAALPKHLVKQNASEAERACAARLHCLGPSAPPSSFEEFSKMVQALFNV